MCLRLLRNTKKVKNNLLKLTSIMLFVLLAFQGYSQITYENIDQRLIDVYGESRLKEMVVSQNEFVDS